MSKVAKVYFDEAATIILSPNPAKDIVTVILKNFEGQTTLQVLNRAGQVLKQQWQEQIPEERQLKLMDYYLEFTW
jgi:hypothetical protein